MPPSCCPDSHSAGTLSRDYALGRHPAAGCSFLANPSVSQILKIPWSDLGGFRRINRPPDLPHRLPLPLAQKPLEPDPPPAVAAWTPGALPAHSTFVLRHSRPPLIGHASFSFRAFFHHSPAPADKRQYRIYTFIENRACSARPPGGSHAAFPPPTRRPITTRGPANAERLDCGRFSAAFARTKISRFFQTLRPPESAAEAGAVKTLRDFGRCQKRAGQNFAARYSFGHEPDGPQTNLAELNVRPIPQVAYLV